MVCWDSEPERCTWSLSNPDHVRFHSLPLHACACNMYTISIHIQCCNANDVSVGYEDVRVGYEDLRVGCWA